MRRLPYQANSLVQLERKFKEGQRLIEKEEVPEDYSLECIDFINRLLQVDPINRLGHFNYQEPKRHKWMQEDTLEEDRLSFKKLFF